MSQIVTPTTNLFQQAAKLYEENKQAKPKNYPLMLVVGDSGTGKTRSIKDLPPQETAIFNLENKPLSFQGADKFPYQFVPAPNALPSDIDISFDHAFKEPIIKYVVIDSFTKYVEILRAWCKEEKKNDKNSYAQWVLYNECIFKFLARIKQCGPKMVILTGIPEIVQEQNVDGTVNRSRRMAVGGKEWEGKIEKEFTIVLFTSVRKGVDGKITYSFQTNSDGTTSAKSPEGMFVQSIDNSLKLVCDTVRKFYNLPE